MAGATVTIDTSPIFEAVEKALNAAGRDWLELARQYAPVSGRNRMGRAIEPGAQSEQFPIRLRAATGRSSAFTGSARALTKTQLSLQGYIEAEGRNKIFRRLVQRHGNRANMRLAQLFVLTKGPNKGKSPDFLIERGNRLLGVSAKQGGTLRDSIYLEPATREGNTLMIRLRSDLKYAAPMEYGFAHKGGTQVPPRAFMRKPLHNIIAPDLKSGKYFKG